MLASGYLKALSVDDTPLMEGTGETEYTLALTNMEVRSMFASMIRGWFKGRSKGDYNGFIKALLADDRKLMNIYMNKVALETISFFDSGNRPSAGEPERFYHGLVLGLLVDLYGSRNGSPLHQGFKILFDCRASLPNQLASQAIGTRVCPVGSDFFLVMEIQNGPRIVNITVASKRKSVIPLFHLFLFRAKTAFF